MAKPAGKKKEKQPSKEPSWLAANFKYAIVLLVVPMLLYAQSLAFNYSYHDDDIMILEGAAALENFTLKDFFTTDAWLRKAQIELYRPWQSLTYAFDHQLAGNEPWAYHLHNVVIFSFSIVLLFAFLQLLFGSRLLAFILSAFYATHYLMSHAACWIPARGDVYVTFFSLSSLLLFVQWCRTSKPLQLAGALGLFFLACLAKENAITMLGVMALLFVGQSNQKWKTPIQWWWLVPAASAVGIYLYLRHGSVYASPFVNLSAVLYNLPTLPEEIFKFFIPAFYSVMPGFKTIPTYTGLLLIIVLTAAVIWRRNQLNPITITTGLAFFLLPLLPSLFYKPVFAGVAYDYLDHRMFLCGIGLLIICGELLKDILAAPNKPVQVAIAAVLILSAALSLYYSRAYTNFDTFYTNAITTNPTSGLALMNYSSLTLNQKKDYTGALQLIDKGIQQYPDSIIFVYQKCSFSYLQKDYDLMKQLANTLVKKWPQRHESYFMMGSYHLVSKNYPEAITGFSKSVELNPKHFDSYFNRAMAYKELSNIQSAVSDLDMAIKYNPQFANAYFQRGNIYGNLGRFNEALKDYQNYVSLKPDDALGYFYRGQAYALSGNKVLGCADLQRAQQMGVPEAAQKLQQMCH